LSEIARC